jgi:hypothetical protein
MTKLPARKVALLTTADFEDHRKIFAGRNPEHGKTARIRTRLLNAAKTRLEPSDPLPGSVNYLVGSSDKWRTGVNGFDAYMDANGDLVVTDAGNIRFVKIVVQVRPAHLRSLLCYLAHPFPASWCRQNNPSSSTISAQSLRTSSALGAKRRGRRDTSHAPIAR